MSRLLMIVGCLVLLSGCDSYYGGAPGYAANGRLPLSQLAGSAFDEAFGEGDLAAAPVRDAKAGDTL